MKLLEAIRMKGTTLRAEYASYVGCVFVKEKENNFILK